MPNQSPESCLEIETLQRRLADLVDETARLGQAVAARDALLAIAGHELRNPMTPIRARVAMLRRLAGLDHAAENLRQGLEQLDWLLDRYTKRATTLLGVSRITSGKLTLSCTPTDVCPIARRTVEAFQPIADYTGCILNVALPDGDLCAMGEALAIEEILENLISNALKYGAGAPIMVSAQGGPVEGEVTLEVSDGGPGIPAAQRQRIFEPFERAVPATERTSGFGVGLWIVRQLTEAMGGWIEVVSQPDAGSTFRVRLPGEVAE
jgi:two-component system OmpR family sensor kinase